MPKITSLNKSISEHAAPKPIQIKNIAELYNQGMKAKDIAKTIYHDETKLHYVYVRIALARRKGLISKPRPMRSNIIPLNIISRLYKQGISIHEIARDVGYRDNLDSIYNAISRLRRKKLLEPQNPDYRKIALAESKSSKKRKHTVLLSTIPRNHLKCKQCHFTGTKIDGMFKDGKCIRCREDWANDSYEPLQSMSALGWADNA